MGVRVTVSITILGISILLSGCAIVKVTVNSMASKNNLSRSIPIVFVKKGEEIESEKLRRECVIGASSAGMKVVDECSENCYWATIEGQTGQSKERVASAYNAYTKQMMVASHNETDRKIKIVIYADASLKETSYQMIADSSGSSNNVLSVAKEMCEGAFRNFPRESTNENFSVY